MSRFAPNGIIALVAEHPRFNLGGSYGANLLLEELLDTMMLAHRLDVDELVVSLASPQNPSSKPTMHWQRC